MAATKKSKRTPSLGLRLLLGKLFGAGIGLIVFLSLPALIPEADLALRFGLWGWYILFGVMVGFVGLFTRHPYFGFAMPPMLRGAVVGFGMNLVLGALVYLDMVEAFASYSDFRMANSVPIIQLAVEGLIWGALIDSLLTKFAGEGKDLAKKL